jgi:hypothetical protein
VSSAENAQRDGFKTEKFSDLLKKGRESPQPFKTNRGKGDIDSGFDIAYDVMTPA